MRNGKLVAVVVSLCAVGATPTGGMTILPGEGWTPLSCESGIRQGSALVAGPRGLSFTADVARDPKAATCLYELVRR